MPRALPQNHGAVSGSRRERLSRFVVALALAALTFAALRGVARNDFVLFDDDAYLTSNPRVLAGLTREGVRWAFRTTYEANWHPLTWLSHMLDVELFDLDPGRHHLVSLGLHAANAVLLFALLGAATGALWRSALVAALFAVHPLHVESVAWASERKDVLCALFWMLASLAWMRHLHRPAPARFLLALLLFAAALLSKSMAVTLPFVWLLCDFWPLGRCRTPLPPWPLWREKLPFLALSTAVSTVTYLAQKGKGAVAGDVVLPFATRVANAFGSYLGYLHLAAWPRGLAVYYPLEPAWSQWTLWSRGALLAGLTWAALRAARRRPYLSLGWLWYLGTLVPVIGFVQVGAQAMADRYTYLPLIGVFLAVSWTAGALADRGPRARGALAGAAVLWVAVLGALSVRQVAVWRDDLTLFGRALAVTERNWMMQNNMGIALTARGDLQGAERHYREALRIRPHPNAYNNLGTVLGMQGRSREAEGALRRAVELRPRHPEAHYNLGLILEGEGRGEEAAAAYREALRINPDNTRARHSLALLLLRGGDTEGAIRHLEEALGVNPRDATVLNSLGVALSARGDHDRAVEVFREVLRLRPDHAEAERNLGLSLAATGRAAEALAHLERAVALQPDYPEARSSLAAALASAGRLREAEAEARAALRLQPDYADALHNLGLILENLGRREEAAAQFRRLLALVPDHAGAREALARLGGGPRR